MTSLLAANILEKAVGGLCSAMMPCYLTILIPIILLAALKRAKPPEPPGRSSMAKDVGREVAKGVITKAIKSVFKL